MSAPNRKRQTVDNPTSNTGAGRPSNKYPLTLHQTGQYCKKIRGKMHYFGKDKQEALQRYYEQASALHTATDAPLPPATDLMLIDLCNLYIDHQSGRAKAGEIQERQCHEQVPRLRAFASFIGPDRKVATIKTYEVAAYRQKRIDDGRSPVTINNELAVVKAMFHWAESNEVIDRGPRLDAVKKIPRPKVKRQLFTQDDIRKLLACADAQWRAMILLGLNCAFGGTDCAELRWENLDLDEGRICFPRPKTNVGRNTLLWPQTVKAIRDVPVRGERVFYTRYGQTWCYRAKERYDVKPHTQAFKRLMKRAGIVAEKGAGFYTLRRMAATIAAETGDAFAVQGLLGHADLTVASDYVQQHKLTPQVDRAVHHAEEWLGQEVTTPGKSGCSTSGACSPAEKQPAPLPRSDAGEETHPKPLG